jgi:5'-nucleotidase
MSGPSSRWLVVACALCACVTGRALRPAPSKDQGPVRITIVGTNDLHGWVAPHDRTAGGSEPILGGIDAFAGYLKILRQKRPDEVVLLDGGDLFQGPLVANLTEGEAVVRAYNMLGFDGVAVGNHEFDYGPVGPATTADQPGEDPLGALRRRMAQANFPFLAANVIERRTGRPPEWPAKRTVLIERQGVRIGLIGLSTPTTPQVTLAQNVEALQFDALAENATAAARELRSQGAQVVVVTMHAGSGCGQAHGTSTTNDPHDVSRCDDRGELFKMMRSLPPGTVDAVVGGHTHQYLAHFVDGVPAIQSGAFGVAFGAIELWVDRRSGKVDPSRTTIWRPVPLCRAVWEETGDCEGERSGALVAPTFLGETVVPDAGVRAALAPDFERVRTTEEERLGPTLSAPLTRVRLAESTLGDFVADVLRGSISGADVAATNSGGLRADVAAGPVTYGHVYNAIPFDNRVAVVELTGSELLDVLSLGLSGEHGVLQISGIRLEAVRPGAKPCEGQPRIVKATLSDGRAVDPAATYRLATNDFVVTGGDGFGPVFDRIGREHVKVRKDLPPLREVVVSHLRSHGSFSGPADLSGGRLVFHEPKCDAAPVAP